MWFSQISTSGVASGEVHHFNTSFTYYVLNLTLFYSLTFYDLKNKTKLVFTNAAGKHKDMECSNKKDKLARVIVCVPENYQCNLQKDFACLY